jgi:hypothetical protein
MKKKLKKNPTLTASLMKMRMMMEEATTSLYTDMMNQLLFFKDKNVFIYVFAPRSQFLRRWLYIDFLGMLQLTY